MCVTLGLSLADEEKVSNEFDSHRTDHQDGALQVGNAFYFLFSFPWIGKKVADRSGRE